jgi:predicted Zn-dependent protease
VGAVISWVLLAGCVKSPVTGRLQLDLVGEDNEIRYGLAADESFTRDIGLYPNDALQAEVSRVGTELAAASERPALPWTFRVLDDATVNAFAVPGGHVYVTRGLLAHLSRTDELAVVLGHEVGHVAARHTVVQMSEGALLGLGVGVVGLLDPQGRHVGGLAAQGAEALFLSFSRSDELAADDLGARYVAATGRDPGAFLPVFDMLQGVEDESTGGERLPTRLRTHPQSADRYARLAALYEVPVAEPDAPWMELLDGMVVGPNPREGFFVGQAFLHPEMAFRLTMPEGWTGMNSRSSVSMAAPTSDAMLQLSLSTAASAAEALKSFAESVGHSGELPADPSAGMDFSVSAELELKGAVAYREHRGAVLELMAVAPAESWPARETELRAALASFAELTDPEVLGVQPMRLVVSALPAPSTMRELEEAEPSPMELHALCLLNQVEPDEPLAAGRLVKRVAGFNPERAPETWGTAP